MQPLDKDPHRISREFLNLQFKEVLKFWRYLGVEPDHETPAEELAAALKARKQADLLPLLYRMNFANSEQEDARGEDLSVERLQLFSRKFFDRFFRNLREADQRLQKADPRNVGITLRKLFPLYILCADYNNVKGWNDLATYEEVNRVIARNNGIIYQTGRTHLPQIKRGDRREPPERYLLPDLLSQFQSGDEIAVILFQARNLAEAEMVGSRVEENLATAAPFRVIGTSGKEIDIQLSATCAACEIPDPQSDAIQIVDDKFTEIKRVKRHRRYRSKRAA